MAEDLKGVYVVGLLLDPAKQKVILIRKERPGWMRGMWNGPGGHVQVGELQHEAVRREFLEETGVDIPNWRWLAQMEARSVADPSVYVTVSFFTATSELFWKVQTQTDEIVQGFSIRDLPRSVVVNLNWLIPMAALDSERNWPYAIKEN